MAKLTDAQEIAAQNETISRLKGIGFSDESIRAMLTTGDDFTPAQDSLPAIAPTSATLIVTKMPLYEYRDIWAEEAGGLANNSAQWSFGNGATGFIGLPIDSGWEVVAMGFHSDTGNGATDLTIELVDYTTPSTAAVVISSIDVDAPGDGAVNNLYKYEELATPASVPSGAVLGFRTQEDGGNAGDARAYARLRRQVGEYVSDVTTA